MLCIHTIATRPNLDLYFIVLLKNNSPELHLLGMHSKNNITACSTVSRMPFSSYFITKPCQTTSSKWTKITQCGMTCLHSHYLHNCANRAVPAWIMCCSVNEDLHEAGNQFFHMTSSVCGYITSHNQQNLPKDREKQISCKI